MKSTAVSMSRVWALAVVLLPLGVGSSVVTGCASAEPTPGYYTRDSDSKWVDSPAMSTGLDKRDLDRMFAVLINDLFSSRFYNDYANQQPIVTVAIAPFMNQTTEHIDGQLDALLSKVETQFIRQGGFAVISSERQDEVVGEVENQQQAVFNPAKAARYGQMIGTEYLVTGKVYDAAERTSDMRRVQYMAFMQVIEVDTGVVRWQMETDVTKAYVAGQQ